MYQKILVINLMYIGDLLFTTPLLHALREHFSNAYIAVMADGKNADVIKNNPYISELIAIDKKGYHSKLSNYINLICDIRQQKFDLVINLHRNERASAIAAFSGAKTIAGFAAKGFGVFFDHLVKERSDIHQAEAYLEVLRAIGHNSCDCSLEIWVDQVTQEKADKLWQESFPYQVKVIGLNTGGSWPTKRWTKEGFAQLADRILEQGNGVAFFGGPMDEADVKAILSLMHQVNHPYLKVFTGNTTLLEMAAMVQKCTAFVSGDSGPMHIAVAQKVPVIAIFGPSDPIRYSPYKQKDAVIRSRQDCLACGEHLCPGHQCMRAVTAEQVYEKLRSKILD